MGGGTAKEEKGILEKSSYRHKVTQERVQSIIQVPRSPVAAKQERLEGEQACTPDLKFGIAPYAWSHPKTLF